MTDGLIGLGRNAAFAHRSIGSAQTMSVTGHSGDTPGQTRNATNTATSLHHIAQQGNL